MRQNSLSYLEPKTWEMVPGDAKNVWTMKAFKFAIKKVATTKLQAVCLPSWLSISF